LADSS